MHTIGLVVTPAGLLNLPTGARACGRYFQPESIVSDPNIQRISLTTALAEDHILFASCEMCKRPILSDTSVKVFRASQSRMLTSQNFFKNSSKIMEPFTRKSGQKRIL